MLWDEKDYSLRLWLQAFKADDLGMDARDGGPRLLGSCNGSSMLFPTSLARLKMSNSSRFTYQLSDGSFMLNDRYFHKLEVGVEKPRVCPPIGPEMIVDKIVPTQPGSSYHIDVTLTNPSQLSKSGSVQTCATISPFSISTKYSWATSNSISASPAIIHIAHLSIPLYGTWNLDRTGFRRIFSKLHMSRLGG